MAESLTGTWTSEIVGFKFSIVLTQTGDALSGVIHIKAFPEKPGSCVGTISGTAVSLTGAVLGEPFKFEGTYSPPNTVTGKGTAVGQTKDLTLTRLT